MNEAEQVVELARAARRRRVVTALLIFVVALAARLPGITYGLPAAFAPDEVRKVEAVADLDDPKASRPTQQPAFLRNTTWVVLKAAAPFRGGVIEGLELDAPVPGVGADRAFEILVGRVWMVALSSVTAVGVYFLGLRLHSAKVGELAGALYCLFPLAIATGQYLKEDTPLTLFVVLAMLGVVAIIRGGSWWAYALTAAACGAAMGAKYIGGLSVGMLVMGHFLSPNRHRLLAVVPLGWAVGALAASPQSVYDVGELMKALQSQTEYLQKGHHDGIAVSPWDQWFTFYLRRALAPGVGILTLAAAAFGMFALVWNRHRAGLVLVAGIVVYYVGGEWMPAKPYPFFARYMLPIVPLVAVAAAVGVVELAWRSGGPGRWRRRSYQILCAIVLMPLFVGVAAGSLRVLPDTRTQATEWLVDRLPPGTVVGLPPGFAASTYVPVLPDGVLRYDMMDVEKLEKKRRREQGVYVLLSGPAIDRYLENPGVKPEVVEFVRRVRAEGKLEARFMKYAGRIGFHNPTIEVYRLSDPGTEGVR